ncbi:NUDIX domain-containing protein [Candidatus Gottesmanbacteria bacterium]|nr:NUDIX domain-containing protein [Candidatus Gottesmanbacteria bacterium]
MQKSTDNQEEIFDVVDEDDKVIGKTTRGETYKNKNLIHRSIYVAIFNKKDEIFMQQRSATKDTDPLKWTISCTGHVGSGNSYEQVAHRELGEELGVDTDLEFVDKFLVRYPNETEMVTLYKANANGPFVINNEEIRQGQFIDQKRLRKKIKFGGIKLALTGEIALKYLGWR